MGPLDKYILSDDALTATSTGFNLQVRSHWYRSLPLSCMAIKAKIDGKPIDEKDITILVNGKTFAYNEISGLFNEWLFVQDAATLQVNSADPLQSGEQYDVEVDYNLYIPYVLIGLDERSLLASSRISKKLNCQ